MRPTTLFISNIAWDFVWQRHQSLAAMFARDSDVIFCELPGIRRPNCGDAGRVLVRLAQFAGAPHRHAVAEPPPAGVRVVRPFILPASGPVACAWNRRLLDRWLRGESGLRAGVDLIVNYSPARTALQLIDRVPHRRLIYDCTNDWTTVRGIPEFLADDDRALLQRADLTLVPGPELQKVKEPLARRIARLPEGVMIERFLLPPRTRPAGAPVALLYYGHLHRQHLNFALIDELARLRPSWQIALVGPVKTPHRFAANVSLIGQQPHSRLRELIAAADGLFLPYTVNEYTRTVFPAKTYECLATGRPIVSTPLPELVAALGGQMRFADDAAGFAAQFEAAFAGNGEGGAARVALARENTWERRYERLRHLIEELP